MDFSSYFPGIIRKTFTVPDGFKINYLSLKFEKKLEKVFRDEYFQGILIQTRFSLLVAIIFYGSFGILDSILIPELLNRFLSIRFLFVIPLGLLIFTASYLKGFQKIHQSLLSLLIFVSGFGIVLMIYYAKDYPYSLIQTSYYTGLLLVFIFGYNFLRLRFWWATLASWMIVVSCEIVIIFFIDLSSQYIIITNFFLISANLIGMFTSYFYELTIRMNFYHKNLLDEEKRKVEKINLHLEERVLERTKDLEKAKKKAVESDKLKSEFLANISHEIRTPMNGILGFASLLNNKELNEEKRKSYLNIINEKGLDLIEILNNLIDISMIESNSMHLNETNFELNTILLNLHEFLSGSFTDSTIKFELDIPENRSDIFIKTDRVKFEQIISNLVINALKYAQQGKVSLGYSIKKKALRIFVSDTGLGIPDQFKPYVFTSFTKNESQRKEFKKGTGLGLAICKGLADLMGAKISYKSISGKGTTFYLDFPIDMLQQAELT